MEELGEPRASVVAVRGRGGAGRGGGSENAKAAWGGRGARLRPRSGSSGVRERGTENAAAGCTPPPARRSMAAPARAGACCRAGWGAAGRPASAALSLLPAELRRWLSSRAPAPRICVVGSGPAGFYTAQHILKVAGPGLGPTEGSGSSGDVGAVLWAPLLTAARSGPGPAGSSFLCGAGTGCAAPGSFGPKYSLALLL